MIALSVQTALRPLVLPPHLTDSNWVTRAVWKQIRARFCFWIAVPPKISSRCPWLAHTRLVSRRLSFVNEFGAQGKVSLASQYDSLFASGPPRPGAQSWPKINVGHADMYLWHAMTQHAVNVILMCSLSVSTANTVEILACLKGGERHDESWTYGVH